MVLLFSATQRVHVVSHPMVPAHTLVILRYHSVPMAHVNRSVRHMVISTANTLALLSALLVVAQHWHFLSPHLQRVHQQFATLRHLYSCNGQYTPSGARGVTCSSTSNHNDGIITYN